MIVNTSRRSALVTGAAVVIALTCVVILRSVAFARQPDVLAWAVTFDLTITIPFLYSLLIIGSGAARAITIVPVFAVCATFAAIVLPRGYQQTLHEMRFVVAPLEVLTIVLLVRNAPHTPVARFAASEITILRYAIFGWRGATDVPRDARSFTVHERSGWTSVMAVLAFLIVAESVGLHLLLQLWRPRVAWFVTALDAYGLLWLFGDFNALRLRPSYIANDVLHLRYGLRWSVAVPRAAIATLRRAAGEADWKRKGVLKVAMLAEPRYVLELREPLVAQGLAGIRKTIDRIAILPDDDVLEEWLSAEARVTCRSFERAARP